MVELKRTKKRRKDSVEISKLIETTEKITYVWLVRPDVILNPI